MFFGILVIYIRWYVYFLIIVGKGVGVKLILDSLVLYLELEVRLVFLEVFGLCVWGEGGFLY